MVLIWPSIEPWKRYYIAYLFIYKMEILQILTVLGIKKTQFP